MEDEEIGEDREIEGEYNEEGCPRILGRGESDSEDKDDNLGDVVTPIEEGRVSKEDIMAKDAVQPNVLQGGAARNVPNLSRVDESDYKSDSDSEHDPDKEEEVEIDAELATDLLTQV